MKKELYFKVWQDSDSVGRNCRFFISHQESLDSICANHFEEKDYYDSEEKAPIFEPVRLTLDEAEKINNDFQGY